MIGIKTLGVILGVALGAASAPNLPSKTDQAAEVRDLLAAGAVADAKTKLVACSDSGNPACQFMLAQWVERGELVERDLDTAQKLYVLSFQNGYEPAGPEILRLTKGKAQPHSPKAPAWSVSPAPDPRTLSAPAIGGIKLGELGAIALSSLRSSTCEDPETSVYRTCKGGLGGPLEDVQANIVIVAGRVDKVGAEGVTAAQCTALSSYAIQNYGQPLGRLGRFSRAFVAAITPDVTREQVPNATFWGKKDEWQAMLFEFNDKPGCALETALWEDA